MTPRHDFGFRDHFTTPGIVQVFLLKDARGLPLVAVRQTGPSRSTLYLHHDTTYHWETNEAAISDKYWLNAFPLRGPLDFLYLVDTMRQTVLA